jgi:DNA-binding HxlR family transcriptional regulator
MKKQTNSSLRVLNQKGCCTPDADSDICICPLDGIIDTISKKWALLIINTIGNSGRIRFTAIRRTLKGIGPKTLSDILKELESERLIRRETFAEIPPRVEYFLTRDGIELRRAIIPLLRWASLREKGNN